MFKGAFLSLSLLILSSFANAEGVTIFETPPADFNQKLQIGACFLKAGDDFLFLHRLPSSTNGNLWGIPGGKIDKGEAAIDGTAREVFEETGFKIADTSKMKLLGKVYIRPAIPADVILAAFRGQFS